MICQTIILEIIKNFLKINNFLEIFTIFLSIYKNFKNIPTSQIEIFLNYILNFKVYYKK